MKNTFPKQYGYMSSAIRSIRNYEKKNKLKRGEQFVINQLDADCFEVDLVKIKK